MSKQVAPYMAKKISTVIDWEWMGSEVEAEFVEIPVFGIVAAGQPIDKW